LPDERGQVVWDGIARQNHTTLHAVIRGAATDRAEADRLLAHAATQPLAQFCAMAGVKVSADHFACWATKRFQGTRDLRPHPLDSLALVR